MADKGFLLLQTAAKYTMFAPNDGVVVGVSGGADSVALLLGLCLFKAEWGLTVYAAHINHQLRGGDAQADEDFVAALCARYDVALTVYRADVRGLAESAGLSLEDAGRRLRYKYLYAARAAYGAQKIAVAHTQDDNAETVLMNLCRGSGLKGLCGIPPVRDAVVRPLLETSRAAVEAFLSARGADYCTDASNLDPSYTRNRVRHRLMPVIAEQLGENAVAVIARNALCLADEEAYLTARAQEAFQSCLQEAAGADSGVVLDIPFLQGLPAALARRVIREGLARLMSGTVTDIGAEDIARVLALSDGRTGRVAELPHGVRARREYQRLVLYWADAHTAVEACSNEGSTAGRWPPVAAEPFCAVLPPDTSVYIPALGRTARVSRTEPRERGGYTKKLLYDNIQAFFSLRTRLPGDRVHIAGVGRRKLQDYFTDTKTPRPLRDRIPLLAIGGEIVWIMDERDRVSGLHQPEPDRPSVWVTLY